MFSEYETSKHKILFRNLKNDYSQICNELKLNSNYFVHFDVDISQIKILKINETCSCVLRKVKIYCILSISYLSDFLRKFNLKTKRKQNGMISSSLFSKILCSRNLEVDFLGFLTQPISKLKIKEQKKQKNK